MDGIKIGASMMRELERRDICLAKMRQYVAQHPDALPVHGGEIMICERLVDKGASLRIELICYGSDNAALTVTHNCFSPDSDPEQVPLHFEKRGSDYYAEIELTLDIPGNTRIEYWATPGFSNDPAETIRSYSNYLLGNRRYGDRLVSFINGKTFVPDSATDCLFDIPRAVQEKGFRQLQQLMELLGCSPMELVASYTPDHDTLEILEELGVKGLTPCVHGKTGWTAAGRSIIVA